MGYIDFECHAVMQRSKHCFPKSFVLDRIKLKDEEAELAVTRSRLKEEALGIALKMAEKVLD